MIVSNSFVLKTCLACGRGPFKSSVSIRNIFYELDVWDKVLESEPVFEMVHTINMRSRLPSCVALKVLIAEAVNEPDYPPRCWSSLRNSVSIN